MNGFNLIPGQGRVEKNLKAQLYLSHSRKIRLASSLEAFQKSYYSSVLTPAFHDH